jgi:hypothetical protein
VGHWPPQIGGSVSAAGGMAAAARRLRPGRRWTRKAARAGRASGRPGLLTVTGTGAAASGPQAVRPMPGTQSESGLRGRGTVTQAPSQADCDRD